jgi:hypothetical protein
MPELERRKDQLAKKREIFISHDAIKEHNKRYTEQINEQKIRRQK